jgi:hypothetical protein
MVVHTGNVPASQRGKPNKNGSSWVTVRHGGDGHGKMVTTPKHTQHDDGDPEDVRDHGADEATEDTSKNKLPDYVNNIADHLKANHGLTHTHATRVAAGITALHAQGHAAVSEAQQKAAVEAHGHMQKLVKGHGSVKHASLGTKSKKPDQMVKPPVKVPGK